MMKKQILLRGLLGGPIGVFIGVIITLIAMYYYNLETIELNQLFNYTIAGFIIGMVNAGASVIWDKDEWSMSKQLISYYVILYPTFIFAAYIGNYFPINMINIAINSIIFIAIYFIITLLCYFYNKSWVHSINNKMKSRG